MVLVPSRWDDSKVPVSEQNQTTSTTEGHVESSLIDILRDLEMSWKQLREEGIITEVRRRMYLPFGILGRIQQCCT